MILSSWWEGATFLFLILCPFPTSYLATEFHSLGSIKPEQFGRSKFNVFRNRRANLDNLSKRLLSLSIDYLSKNINSVHTQILCMAMLFCFGWLTYMFIPPPPKVQILTHMNSMKWLRKGLGRMIASRFWDSINIALLWKDLGTIWHLLMEGWSYQINSLLLFPSEHYVTATSAESVTCVPVFWPAVHSDSHEGSSSPWWPPPKASWSLCVQSTLRTWKTCQDVLAPIQHNSVLNKKLSLKEGQPSVHQHTVHLT